MADSKITALTALTAADPANDMIPIVDVSDTPPASGNTKRISINNILACSPSATLASATITGDLTVDTSTLKVDSANNRVGIGTAIPAVGFDVGYTESVFGSSTSSGYSILNLIGTGTGSARYGSIRKNYDSPFDLRIRASNSNSDAPIIFELSNASTAMTLNSTGLGVGDSPSYKLHVARNVDGTVGYFRRIGSTINPALTVYCNETGNTVGFGTDYAGATSPAITFTTAGTERLRIDSSGNVISNVTGTAPTLATNSQMVFNLTSNTNLRISVRGTDGTTRTANITLA